MNIRLSDEQLEFLAKDVEAEPALAALISYNVVTAVILDLRDARARIRDLETLSASQEEALGMMERGHL